MRNKRVGSLRHKFAAGIAVLGGMVGLILAFARYSADILNVLYIGLLSAAAGWTLGSRLGGLIFRDSTDHYEKEPRKHYYLPKEMRDGYHTGLVMKRIMEIYHPEQAGDEDEDEADSEEPGEEEVDDRFSSWREEQDRFDWPAEMQTGSDEQVQPRDPEAARGDSHSDR